jgi:hypothetical protein
MLESGDPEKHFEALRQELIFVACAYLDARLVRPRITSAFTSLLIGSSGVM